MLNRIETQWEARLMEVHFPHLTDKYVNLITAPKRVQRRYNKLKVALGTLMIVTGTVAGVSASILL